MPSREFIFVQWLSNHMPQANTSPIYLPRHASFLTQGRCSCLGSVPTQLCACGGCDRGYRTFEHRRLTAGRTRSEGVISGYYRLGWAWWAQSALSRVSDVARPVQWHAGWSSVLKTWPAFCKQPHASCYRCGVTPGAGIGTCLLEQALRTDDRG